MYTAIPASVPSGLKVYVNSLQDNKQEGRAVASIARDDPSTLPGDDPSPRARMHRDHNAR